MKQSVTKVLSTFAEQEAGNRVTQFNMSGLHGAILQEIDRVEREQNLAKAKADGKPTVEEA